jgi:hypothetical protein
VLKKRHKNANAKFCLLDFLRGDVGVRKSEKCENQEKFKIALDII